ncbi:hypothetical protein D3C86_1677620 [compost metagenome]
MFFIGPQQENIALLISYRHLINVMNAAPFFDVDQFIVVMGMDWMMPFTYLENRNEYRLKLTITLHDGNLQNLNEFLQ